MIDFPSARFESGYDSIADGPLPQHPLCAALKADDTDRIRRELNQLLRQVEAGELSSAAFCDVLLTVDADGDSAWHAICKRPGRSPAPWHLMDGIVNLADAGRLDPADARMLFCARDDAQMSALHLITSRGDDLSQLTYGQMLVKLHDQGHLPDADFAAVLLQDWHGETIVQRALLSGNGGMVDGTLGLLSVALKDGAITEAQVCDALSAPRFAGFPSRGRAPSPGPRPSPLCLAFATAAVPTIKAVLDGVESMCQTGRMRADRLRGVLEPAFRATGTEVRPSSSEMAKQLAQAHALVALARESWYAHMPVDTATAAPSTLPPSRGLRTGPPPLH